MKSGAAEKQAVLAGYRLADEIREYLKGLSGTCCQHWVNWRQTQF